MFDRTEVTNENNTISPLSPNYLRLITDKKGFTYVIQTECIVSVEPSYYDPKQEPDLCHVKLTNGEKIRIYLSPEDFFNVLKNNQNK